MVNGSPVEITMRATVLDVTPDQGGDEAPEEMNNSNAAATAQPEADTASVPEETEAPAEEAVVEEAAAEGDAPAEDAALDPELVAAGERVFKKCQACHQVGEGAQNKTGPVLNGVVDRDIASVDGFSYSGAMDGMDGVWDSEALHAFLAKPRDYVKGTKMAFAGLRKAEEIDAVIEYLKAHP